MKTKLFFSLLGLLAAFAPHRAAAAESLFPELFQTHQSFSGSASANFAWDVAVDGSHIAVALPDWVHAASGEKRGAVDIYEATGHPLLPTWQFRQRIEGPPLPTSWMNSSVKAPSFFAHAMELRDGILAIGQKNYGSAPLEENKWSVVHFYQLNASTGLFQDFGGQVQSDTGAKASVSVTLAGDLAAVGSEKNRAYIYRRGPSGYSRVGEPITASGITGFGDPVLRATQAISLDGNRLVVGSPRQSSNRGIIHTYVIEGDAVSLAGQFTPATGSNTYFGDSVVIRGDTLAASAPASSGVGSIYTYRWTGVAWVFNQQLTHSAATGNARLGIAGIELSDDGRTLIATTAASPYVSWMLGEDGSWHERAGIGSGGDGIALSGTTLVSAAAGSDSVQTYLYDDSNSQLIANDLRARLYQEDAANTPLWQADQAAFRYRGLIYEEDEGAIVRSESSGTTAFGAAEQVRVDAVLAELESRLDKNPFAASYAELYLDIIYDLTRVKFLQAQDALIGLDRARLEPPAGQPVITSEITLYQTNLSMLRGAIATMLESFDADIAYTTSGAPAGYVFFKDHVPGRAVMPVSRLDSEGNLVPLEDKDGAPITDPLVGGHRDAILFFDMLAEYGNSTAELAYLYWLNEQTAEAAALLRGARELLFLQGSMVRGMFRDEELGDPEDLRESIAHWEGAINQLKGVRVQFDNGLNPLGYDDDFLVLLQRSDGDSGSVFNTFNILLERIDDTGSSGNYLYRALEDLQAARDAYADYRGGLDELELGLISVNGDARNRLEQLVGHDYIGERALYDSVPGANVGNDGGFVSGSELWDQYQNIRRARLQIQRNGQEMANLEEKVRIEVARAQDISNVYVSYANQRAGMEEEIGRLNAAQAYTEVLAEACNPANWGQVVGNAINGGMQLYGELRKGELAAERERLAGQEQAEIEGINSAAQIETWLLDMKTLALSSQESGVILQQEVGRLVGLLREKETLERRVDSHAATLASRYFADPVHRLRYLSELIDARRSFETAQQTIFLMARALEYKWNEPFDDFLAGVGSNTTTMTAIYRARNAAELQTIVDDMRLADGTNIGVTDYESQFSLKEDAFGYSGLGSHPDPISGEMVDATTAFRSLLRRDFLVGDPASSPTVILRIPFSTVRDPLNSFFGPNFFRGPRGLVANPDGSLSLDPLIGSTGRYRDKIQQLAVTMPGTYSPGPVQTVCDLYYGGTSFLRTRSLGRYTELLDETAGLYRFDRLAEEITAVPVRASTFLNGAWQTTDTQRGAPTVQLTADVWPMKAVAPPESAYVDTFRERSVAANGWEIRVTLKDGFTYASIDEISDIILHIRHQASVRSE